MKKQTTRQRIEQAVEKAGRDADGFKWHHLDQSEIVKLILAERRRIRREVRRLSRFTFDTQQGMVLNEGKGAWVFRDDIIARLRG